MDAANLLRLVSLAAIWGGSFLFMRIGVPAFGPAAFICLRMGIAAVFLWLVCRALGQARLERGQWKHFLFIGLFNSALPFTLFAYAAQSLSASLLSIMNSTSPIFGTFIAALWLRTPVTREALLGQALGIGGVCVIVSGSLTTGAAVDLVPLGAALLAASCYGIAGSYTRWAKVALEPLTLAHGSLWAATLLLVPLALALPIRQAPSPLQWGAVSALGVVCTGAAFLLYFRLIRDCGPTRALSVTFLIPVFGVLWGALFLGESVGLGTLAGGALVLLGTALTNGLLRLGRAGAAPSSSATPDRS